MKEPNKEDNKPKTNLFIIMLSFLILVALSVMLVGTTFAYFTGKAKGNETSEVIVKSSNVMLQYNQLNEINDVDIYPGWEKTLDFTIENLTIDESIAKYQISLEIFDPLTNQPINDFVYSLSGTSNVAAGRTDVLVNKTANIPVVTTEVGVGTLANGVTHTYTLTVRFKETGLDQSQYTGKSFSGKIKVVRVPSV